MVRAKPFGNVHIVSAAEAAYAQLYGHFHIEQPDAIWGATWPVIYTLWPRRLRAFYAEITTAASIPKPGVPIWLYSLWRPTDALGLAIAVQGFEGGGVSWYGNLPCEYGVGVMVRAGSVVAGDHITVGGVYEAL